MPSSDATGAVLVVGGGIGGIQTALDLAEMGFFVYLVESGPAIGGRMAQLDKTFPTNDCAMCMLSPKLVEAGRHPNIRILTLAELEALEGRPGAFVAHVRQRPRYVNVEKCIGCSGCVQACVYGTLAYIDEDLCCGCGVCVSSCPFGAIRLDSQRRVAVLDEDRCMGCGTCAATCPSGAAQQQLLSDEEIYEEIDQVLEVARSPKTTLTRKQPAAGVPNEFDEGLSRRRPVYIRFPQAVPLAAAIDPKTCHHFVSGSCVHNCFKACPRGAIDFAQQEETLQLSVGAIVLAPGFEPYDARLVGEYGFGRYANVLTGPQFERLLSASGPTMGKVLRPSDGQAPKRVAFIQCVGSRDLRHQSYCSAVCCMYATKEAIVAKEHDHAIEPTIFYMDLRAYGKGFENLVKRAKEEHGVRYIRSMISQIAEIPKSKNLLVRYYALGANGRSPSKLHEEEFDLVVLAVGMRPHSQGQELARRLGIELDEHGFAKTQSSNPVASTREGVFVTGAFTGPKDIPETVIQASAAAAAAGRLLASARYTRTQTKSYPPESASDSAPRVGVFVCHCGSNIAGVVNVKAVAEYARSLPGVVHSENVLYTCSQDNLKHMKEVIREKQLNRVVVASCTPRNLEALFQDTIREAGLNKFLFEMVNIREQCSWVHSDQPERATEKAKDLVRMGVAKARELKPLTVQAVPVTPSALVIGGGLSGLTAALTLADSDFETYIVENADLCAESELSAKARAHPKIRLYTGATLKECTGFSGNFSTTLSTPQGEEHLQHGVVIVAQEAQEFKPNLYLYGEDPRVLTQGELEEQLLAPSPSQGEGWGESRGKPRSLKNAKKIVMIQCVGRDEQRPYCSRICCRQALQNALALLDQDPSRQIYLLFREMMTYGLSEALYRRARERGVVFVRYDEQAPPRVHKENERLEVTVHDVQYDQEIELETDLVVLSTGVVPQREQNEELGRKLKVPVDAHGFFVEAHIKLRPVDFASHGIYLCGSAHAPGTTEELIAKAQAAAGRAAILLSKTHLEAGGVVAVVEAEKCAACLTCLRECPYGAVFINSEGLAEIEAVKCQGCGICAADCPAKAIQLRQFEDRQELAMLEELLEGAL